MTSFRPGLVISTIGALVSVFLLMPLLAVIPVSFTPKRFLSLPDGEWSFRHYQALIEDPGWMQSLLLSIKIGIVSSSLACLLATAFCLGIWLFRPVFSGLLTGFVLLPMVAPPVVSALTLYFFLTSLTQYNGIIAYDKWAGVAVTHAVMTAPYAVVLLMVALSQLDRRIDLAAQSMGAGLGTRIFKVILPNIRFGIAGAFLLCFLLSWDEIGVTLFVTSVDAITLPRRMWMGLRDNIDPAIAALSVVLIGLVTILTLIRSGMQYRARKRAQG
ncbi:ABC transporter permease [Paracoccus sp. MBLB3053]|uniref:ABC transporter permease n=1 Tax=Paracoccus aurantius TaxID=3073814 RepID=A0ABU2HWA7_9RHOB|nr:ABC transporter permease [Paracoccus sp. MBLB3053]MDS9469311.1 ABC transporter permease [Paracoccus sp. MBLB3053]